MNEKRIPVGEHALVHLNDLSGVLRVSTWQENEILAQCDTAIDVAEEGQTITLTCKGDCALTLPEALGFRFDEVRGDAHIVKIRAGIEGNKVQGDLLLASTGTCSIGAVGGDAAANNGAGDLQLGAVGGDLSVDTLTGNLSAAVGGDLRVSSATGGITANTGGSARLEYSSVSHGAYAVQAGGNIDCRLPGDADVTVNLQYGGSLRTSDPFRPKSGPGHLARYVLGNGQAVMNLMAGGDIILRGGSEHPNADPAERTAAEDIGREFADQMEDAMRQVAGNLESQLAAMARELDAQLGGIPNGDAIAARVHEQMQKVIARAEAKVEKAARRAEKRAVRAREHAAKARSHGAGVSWSAARPQRVRKVATVSDEERMAVLRMVADGKLSVDEAEQLLAAMEA